MKPAYSLVQARAAPLTLELHDWREAAHPGQHPYPHETEGMHTWGRQGPGALRLARCLASSGKTQGGAKKQENKGAARLRQAAGAAHVVKAEHGGAALGRAAQQLGRVDLDEPLAQQRLAEQLRRGGQGRGGPVHWSEVGAARDLSQEGGR